MFKKYKEIFTFDKVTKFRLINLAAVTIGLNLLLPLIIDLRGELLDSSMISFFMILSTLAVKLNNYFVQKFTISQLFQLGNITHFILLLTVSVYFINPLIFIYLEGCFLILQIAIFSSYSIKLDVYQSNNYPETVSRFKILRNSIYADTCLIALLIVTITSTFFSRDISFYIFLIYNSFFNLYLIYNWNYYKKIKTL